MTCVKQGSELPEGTKVYLRMGTYNNRDGTGVYLRISPSHPMHGTIHKNLDLCSFIYDPKDEMWATYYTRKFWLTYPHLHSHSTLFDLLSKKL